MPVSSDDLLRLSALGLTVNQIAGVIKVMEEADEVRKAVGRDRTRRHRERHATQRSVTLQDVTADYSELHDDAPEIDEISRSHVVNLPEETLEIPTPKEPLKGVPKGSSLPEPKPSAKAKTRGTRLSPDWQASAANTDYAASLGVPSTVTSREADRFRDWALSAPGTKGVKLDWDAAWRNWIRRVADEKGYAPTMVTDAPKTEGPRVVDPETPQWRAWLDHRRRLGERTAFMEAEAKAGRGYQVPTEWPPSIGQTH